MFKVQGCIFLRTTFLPGNNFFEDWGKKIYWTAKPKFFQNSFFSEEKHDFPKGRGI